MADYPYTTVPGKISEILSKIREVGIPEKASQDWIKAIGFRSSNDRSLLTVIRYIGFIDNSSVPTTVWNNYRGSNHASVLASAIQDGYSNLFSVYPTAHMCSAEEIEHVIGTSSSSGRQTVSKKVSTFMNLCSLADFSTVGSAEGNNENVNQNGSSGGSPSGESSENSAENKIKPSLHIDIQVHISPESSADQVDQIFESMAKHLYRKNSSE